MRGAIAKLLELVRDVGEERANAERELERLRQEREALDSSPLPKADFIAQLNGYVDTLEPLFAANLTKIVERLRARPDRAFQEIPGGVPFLVSFHEPRGLDLAIVSGLLSMALKDRVSATVARMEWPAPGPAFAARPALRQRLDAQIAEAQNVVDQINRGLVQTGRAIGDTDGN